MNLKWTARVVKFMDGYWPIRVLLALGICAAVYSAAEFKANLPVREVRIDLIPLEGGEKLITERDLFGEVDRYFRHDWRALPVCSLNIRELEDYIVDIPFVKDAEVYVDAANRLHLQIEQRNPLVRIMERDMPSFYLDEHGQHIPVSPHYALRVPVATGVALPAFRESERQVTAEIIDIAKAIRQDTFLNKLVEQIHRDRNGEYTLVPKIGEEKIILGSPEDIGIKMEKLRLFYREGLTYEGWGKYKTIDLRFRDQVVCKKKT